MAPLPPHPLRQAIGVPVPKGAATALAEKLRKLRRFLLEATALPEPPTHMDLLKELEPVLEVKYRFTRGSGDPWERFKAVDATGFVVAENDLTTMFDSNMTMTSLLRKASTRGASKLAGEVQGGH
jgi:hypothetical protein